MSTALSCRRRCECDSWASTASVRITYAPIVIVNTDVEQRRLYPVWCLWLSRRYGG